MELSREATAGELRVSLPHRPRLLQLRDRVKVRQGYCFSSDRQVLLGVFSDQATATGGRHSNSDFVSDLSPIRLATTCQYDLYRFPSRRAWHSKMRPLQLA